MAGSLQFPFDGNNSTSIADVLTRECKGEIVAMKLSNFIQGVTRELLDADNLTNFMNGDDPIEAVYDLRDIEKLLVFDGPEAKLSFAVNAVFGSLRSAYSVRDVPHDDIPQQV